MKKYSCEIDVIAAAATAGVLAFVGAPAFVVALVIAAIATAGIRYCTGNESFRGRRFRRRVVGSSMQYHMCCFRVILVAQEKQLWNWPRGAEGGVRRVVARPYTWSRRARRQPRRRRIDLLLHDRPTI